GRGCGIGSVPRTPNGGRRGGGGGDRAPGRRTGVVAGESRLAAVGAISPSAAPPTAISLGPRARGIAPRGWGPTPRRPDGRLGKTRRVRRPLSGMVFAPRSVRADADGATAAVCRDLSQWGLGRPGAPIFNVIPPARSAPVKLVQRNCLGQEDVMKGLMRIVVPLLLSMGTARAACTDAAAVAATRAAASAQCRCETFAKHKSYVHCVAQAAKAAATSGSLPKQ